MFYVGNKRCCIVLYCIVDGEVAVNPDCLLRATQWSVCTHTCGVGTSHRMSNNNAACLMISEYRMCYIRPCGITNVSSATLIISLTHQTSLSVATDCNRLQPIGMLGVSPNLGANGFNTSNTSVLLASRRENAYRL